MGSFRSLVGPTGPNDYLEELILQGTGEVGKVPMSDADGGFVQLSVVNEEMALTVPTGAVAATIMVEADATAVTPTRCLRFTENDTEPTSSVGFFLGDGDIYEISGSTIATFSMITIEAGKTTVVSVQFYSSIKPD